jgi:hypothetical protein
MCLQFKFYTKIKYFFGVLQVQFLGFVVVKGFELT